MRFFALAVLALPSVLAASILPRASECSAGPVYCCNETYDANTNQFTAIRDLSLVGVIVGDVLPQGLIGKVCTPTSVIGAGAGSKCEAQTVCCDKSYQGGLVNIGCKPTVLLA
ncbi:hydrophobin [Schizophyllum fasciatum]